MTTRVLFFGRLRDAAGGGERQLSLEPGLSIDGVIDLIAKGDATLGAALRDPAIHVAIDQRLVARSSSVGRPNEIAFLPPYSGG